jgi:hypothetical protein
VWWSCLTCDRGFRCVVMHYGECVEHHSAIQTTSAGKMNPFEGGKPVEKTTTNKNQPKQEEPMGSTNQRVTHARKLRRQLYLQDKAGPVFNGPAVLIGALVSLGGQKFLQQVPVPCGPPLVRPSATKPPRVMLYGISDINSLHLFLWKLPRKEDTKVLVQRCRHHGEANR